MKPVTIDKDSATIQEYLNTVYLAEAKILNLLPVAVYIIDALGHIVNYNQKAEELWGRVPQKADQNERFCGSLKLYSTDGSPIPHHHTPVAQSLADGQQRNNMEVIIERPDLSRIIVRANIVPIKDEQGNILGIVNCFYDITDQKKNQTDFHELTSSLEKKVEIRTHDLEKKNEELRKSEERYHKMIEEVEDYAIILLDKDGIIRNWNKGAEKIKGYKEEEILGKSFENFYLAEDRQRGLPRQLITKAREQGKAIHEGWRLRKDGTIFWGSIVLTALHDEDRNVIGFSKVTRDLTERKLAEDKMKEYTSQLEFQNMELEQFVYAASHDMKEPLRKIHFYNSFIADSSLNQLDEKSKLYLNRSVNAVKRMNTLIEDLLTYSKTTSSIENFEEVDLNELFAEIVLLHKEEFGQKNIRIEMKNLPVVPSIPFQFRQLIDNLISNSIKYKHPERDLVITIKSRLVKGSALKEKGADSDKDYHQISIIDNGVGFESQYAEKIFEIFQRLNNLSGAKGSGIGLAICKKVVQNHKGFIKAEGKKNEGARFDIFIPTV